MTIQLGVARFDRGELRGKRRTSQGFLRVDGIATRAGVFTYRNADGSTRREWRPPAEVAKAECLQSLEGCPVTDNHPEDMVTAENARELARGFTGYGVRMDGALVHVPDVTITDSALIAQVESGVKAELSCGYVVDYDPTPGVTPDGEPYDGVQRNIRNNHLAVVERGRAGPVARLRLDAAEQIEATETPARHDHKENRMLLSINGAQVDVPDAAGAVIQAKLREDAQTIETIKADRDASRGEATAEKTRADGLAGELVITKAELAKRGDAVSTQALVAARLDLERKATAVLPAETKLDGLSDRQVKEAVIKHVNPEVKLDGESDAFIDGAFKFATASTRSDGVAQLRQATGTPGAKEDPGAKARQDMIEREQNAWKGPAK